MGNNGRTPQKDAGAGKAGRQEPGWEAIPGASPLWHSLSFICAPENLAFIALASRGWGVVGFGIGWRQSKVLPKP